MKKSLRLAFGLGILTTSFGLVGCDSGSSNEGLPPAGEANSAAAKAISDEMLKTTMTPRKKAAPLVGASAPAGEAPAADAAKK